MRGPSIFGTLIGDIRDEKAQYVPGARISTRNEATGFIRSGSGNILINFALHRRFHVRERQVIEFRTGAFNLLNHPIDF